MKYWTINGMGYRDLDAVAYDMSIGRNPSGWDHFTYVIKAADIEAAFHLFDKHVGHSSFEGFAEFAKELDVTQVNIFYIAELGEAIWRFKTAREGPTIRIT